MKKFTIVLSAVCLILFSVNNAKADIKKLAQTGLQFLRVDVGARPAAMGGSYTMVGNDASSQFYNPAGIANRGHSDFEFFVNRTQWIADISYNAAALVKSLNNWGVIGVNAIFCDYGNDIIGTQVASTEKGFVETGNVDLGAYAIGLTYARRLTDKFIIGGNVKYALEHLGESMLEQNGATLQNKVSGLAYDFGTIFYPGFKSFRLGMSIRNFSSQFKYQEEAFQLPLTFKIGFAMDVMDFIGEHNNPLTLSIDAIHPRSYTERINVGAEYILMNVLALRAGYRYNYDEEGFTGGLGFMHEIAGFNINIGYAYSDFGIFNSVNRISFSVSH